MTASDKLAELYSATQLFHLSKPAADVRSAQIQTLCYQLHELLSTVDDLRGLAIAVLDRKTGKDIVDRIVCCHDALDSLDSNEDDNAFVAAASSDSDEGSSTDDQDNSSPIVRTSRTAGKQTTESISINNSSTKRQTNTRHCRTKSLSRVAASDSQPKPSSVTSSLPSIPDLLTQLYGMKVKICDLFTNVPTDLHTVTARLRMRNQGKVIPAANDNTVEVSHISTSFGEITLDGFDKILHYLMEQVPPELQLGTESSFLDVGSGFGQCVLHTRIRCAVQTTRGIEYVPIRHQKAQELLQAVSTTTRSALSQLSWAGIELAEGDANAEQYREWLNAATHIYMFDARFSETCKRSLLKSIASCDYRVLACFDPPDHVRELVGDGYSLIGQIGGLVTTGGNQFTCYFYKHAPRVSMDRTEGSGNSYTSISSTEVRAVLPISIIDTQRDSATSNSDSEKSNASSSSDSDEEFDQPRKRAKHNHSVAHISVHSTEELQAILVAELRKAQSNLNQTVENRAVGMQMVHLMAEEAIKAINAMKDKSAEPTDIQSVSLNHVSITIDQVVASSQACKMIAYFFRGLLARALKAHCIRVGTSFRASARVELGILSPTDQCALLQFVSCIERYHKGQQLTVESLLLMPLVRADVSWRRWRYLLGAKGRIVLERAMAEFESQHISAGPNDTMRYNSHY